MAVDSHHDLHLLQAAGRHHHRPAPALHWQANLAGSSAAVAAGNIDASLLCPSTRACYGGEVFTGGEVQCQGYQGIVAPPKEPDQYSKLMWTMQEQRNVCSLDRTDHQHLSNKRKHGDYSSALERSSLAVQTHEEWQEIENLILNYVSNMFTGLVERARQHTRLITAAVDAKASKRVREKDEQIERLTMMNAMLQEQLRAVYNKANLWRDVARSNEAVADVLRRDLEQALKNAQALHGHDGGADAESCFYGDKEEVGTVREQQSAASTTDERTCKACGKSPAVALLLPCRHLCACASCAATVPACPDCGCDKNDTICVNFS